METKKLFVTSMFLLLSGISAPFAQTQPYYGDRPYYDNESSGWLDYEYHAGIDYSITPGRGVTSSSSVRGFPHTRHRRSQ
jgi:hypothetical protein